MSIAHIERGIALRLWVIGIPSQWHSDFVSEVTRWLRCSGVEWTVKRLKGLKVDLFRRKAGLPSLTWIRKNSRGDIAGVIGALFRWADKSEKNFQKVVQTLMAYSVFVHEKASPAQVKKFTSAVTAPPPVMDKEFLNSASRAIQSGFRKRSIIREGEVSLLTYQGSPGKRKPSLTGGSTAQDYCPVEEHVVLTATPWGNQLYREFKDLFDPVLDGLQLEWRAHSFGPVSQPENVLGGKVAFLQEAGLKLRAVASPFLIYQLALRHFGRTFYRIAQSLPWDCTHDQSAPIPTLQAVLGRGQTIHSVDLSNATDYFPLEWQSMVCRSLVGESQDLKLFELLSRATWLNREIGKVRWTRGQPLGLYPSFAVFTVSHGILLWYLNGQRWNSNFFVVGDDVVITDDRLYRRYIDTLQEWGCPWSLDKSLSSDRICEFAGKVITANSVTPQLKWREMSANNFVDLCRLLGRRSERLLTPRQRRVFNAIKHCSLPLGLNFSYPNSTLGTMEELHDQTFGRRPESVLTTLMDQRPVINRNLAQLGSRFQPVQVNFAEDVVNQTRVSDLLTTFDEKVKRVLRQLLGWVLETDPQLLSGVPRALENFDLPSESVQPSCMTLLDRYERMLQISSP